MIIKIVDSPLKNKRYRAELKDGRKIDFGLRGGFTYIDGADTLVRTNYWRRHLGNKTENRLIHDLVLSPSLLSAYVLWGQSRSIEKNVSVLNKLLGK